MYHQKLALVLLLSVVLSLCHGAAIFPKTLRTQAGSASSSSLKALQSQDQSGTQDSWNKYIEFNGQSTKYSGTFTFDVSAVLSTVPSYTLNVNFKGPKQSAQVWQFEFYLPNSDSWIIAGDNTNAASWTWTSLSFVGTESFSNLVKDGIVQVRYSSVTAFDDSDLDYLAIITSDAPTSAPTTVAPTTAPTQKPTVAAPSTVAPTSAPTKKPTAAPSTAPTTRPTSKPTATAAPSTVAPTAAPTAAPTVAPTSAPTSSPVSTSGRMCPTGQVWAPQPGTTWQWQLVGTIDQSVDVQVYDIDLFDNSAATIASLHSKGRAVICYFSTQYENWRSDAAAWTSSVLGNNLDDWAGEKWADIRSPVVRKIMTDRLDMAVAKGCDGVEPDNVDAYANSNGLGLTAADQLSFNRFMASEAHKRGLSIGLKNDGDQVTTLQSSYDWALNEQCNQYSECSDYSAFTAANKAVFGTEYSGSAATFCPKMNQNKFSWLLKDLSLDAKITQCCAYGSNCATKAPYTCKTYTSKRSIEDVEVEEVVADDAPEVAFAVAEQLAADSQDSSASTAFPAVAITVVVALALML